MPRKTRKEKQKASQRKQIIQEVPVKEMKVSQVEKPLPKHVIITYTEEDNLVRNYFLKDLRKSLFLTAVIFTLEFFFYFATIGKYFDRYLKF